VTDTPPTDRSDTLTLLKCYRIILSDLHPTGEWMLHDLYQRYINRPYGGLTNGQMDQLLAYLRSEIATLTPQYVRDWLTTRHQPLETDAPTQAPNLPEVDC
jgi:hypothetical protein